METRQGGVPDSDDHRSGAVGDDGRAGRRTRGDSIGAAIDWLGRLLLLLGASEALGPPRLIRAENVRAELPAVAGGSSERLGRTAQRLHELAELLTAQFALMPDT